LQKSGSIKAGQTDRRNTDDERQNENQDFGLDPEAGKNLINEHRNSGLPYTTPPTGCQTAPARVHRAVFSGPWETRACRAAVIARSFPVKMEMPKSSSRILAEDVLIFG
jgi:hypothetical protein